jgi:hypothetical protein
MDYVVLTNARFITVENHKIVNAVNLTEIKDVYHRQMGLFKWDIVEIIEKSGHVSTFSIYEELLASFFTEKIREEIVKNSEDKMVVPIHQVTNMSIDPKSNCCLYILLCKEGMCYVGRVNSENDVDRRYKQHIGGEYGSAWTRKYPPVKIERCIPNSSLFHEDSTVIELIKNL